MNTQDPLLHLLARFREEREITLEGTPIRVLNIDGLCKTKTDFREKKDLLDKQVLSRIKQGLDDESHYRAWLPSQSNQA